MILLGLTLRLINLNQSFWLDEAISVLTARNPFPQQWSHITGDFQPPLYYLLLHFLMKFHIYSEWFLRIPSVVFGVITIYALYKIAKELFGTKNALLSALFLAISQYHVYYSQELRMYSLLCLSTTLSMYSFYKRKWILYALIGIIGIYTSYIFIFLFIPQFLWLVTHHGLWLKTRKSWVMSLCVIFIAFSFWIPNFLKQWETGKNIVATLPQWKNISSLPAWNVFPQLFLKFSLGRISVDNKLVYGIIFFSLVIFYLYIYKNIKMSKNIIFVFNWFFTPLIVIIATSFFIPIANIWRLLFLFPPFIMITSEGLIHSKYVKVFTIFIIVIHLSANILYWTNPRYQREQWREATEYTDTYGFPVLFTVENGFAPYIWYSKSAGTICGAETINMCLKSSKVFYIPYLSDLFDRENKVETIIETTHTLKETRDFPGVGFVHLYENRN